ncbi:MAG: hypothetical protein IMY78_00090, partial [Chloroflexi bacterium]|nr:hypothetical protein [Chloroflexota bacterium]
MKSGHVLENKEGEGEEKPIPAIGTDEGKAESGMRVLIAVQGYYGERIVDNI